MTDTLSCTVWLGSAQLIVHSHCFYCVCWKSFDNKWQTGLGKCTAQGKVFSSHNNDNCFWYRTRCVVGSFIFHTYVCSSNSSNSRRLQATGAVSSQLQAAGALSSRLQRTWLLQELYLRLKLLEELLHGLHLSQPGLSRYVLAAVCNGCLVDYRWNIDCYFCRLQR